MKYSIVIYDDEFLPHFAKNLLTVYKIKYGEGWDDTKTIRLLNLCYVKGKNEFIFNRNIQLPERLIKRYDSALVTDQMILEMESIGIVNANEVTDKIKLHEECKDFIAYQDYRNKLLNQNYNYVEAIEQMNMLRNDLLEINKNNKVFQLEKKLM